MDLKLFDVVLNIAGVVVTILGVAILAALVFGAWRIVLAF